MDYLEAFRHHAKKELPDWQYARIHHRAHSAAGGSAPRKSTEIQKDMPGVDQSHVDVPLGSDGRRRRKSLYDHLINKAMDNVAETEARRKMGKQLHWMVAKRALAKKTLQVPIKAHLRVAVVKRADASNGAVPIIGANAPKQILYCVVLEPDTFDFQNDIMTPEEIEKAAHDFMTHSRVIGSMHEREINARPVESYIAPQDLEFDGINGNQLVRKGSWVLGIKVNDPEEWSKVLNGEYQGISVHGEANRDPVEGEA